MKTRTFLRSGLIIALLLLLIVQHVVAGSATWNLNPFPSGEWNTANNWTPATVSNGPDDVATFGVSNVTTVVFEFEPSNEVAEMVFNPGASAFTFDVSGEGVIISGAGITN